jgi:FkbM family methyltransferase
VGPTGRVVAVEPQARLTPLIRANLELNGVTWARVVEAAVAETSGTRQLFLTASTNTGASGFFRRTRYHLPTVEVRTLTLGALLEESGVEAVDLLKVDVEGAELSILEGARELLASGRIRALTLDVHAATLAARELDPERPRRLLKEAGYRVEQGGGVEVWVRER